MRYKKGLIFEIGKLTNYKLDPEMLLKKSVRELDEIKRKAKAFKW